MRHPNSETVRILNIPAIQLVLILNIPAIQLVLIQIVLKFLKIVTQNKTM